jgi:hypothetical protein
MRPTIDEQLDGAARLLRLAEEDPEATPAVAELVRNARRLVERVGTSWSTALPFLRADNAQTAELLGVNEPGTEDATADLAAMAARNEELRAELTRRIRQLPAGPDRAAIGEHLRARVAADPT